MPSPAGLHVHRAERADRLVAGLAGLLAEPVDADPFVPELVAVPTRGIERWLAQELSRHLGAAGAGDGVCAHVEFPFPATVVGWALAAAADLDPDTDPWRPRRLVWPLLETIDAHLDEDWLAPLRSHLGGPSGAADPLRRSRRFAAARHLADLFDRYAVHRPGMLADWAADRDTDGEGEPLESEAAWQAALWRRTWKRVGGPSPAERLDTATTRLEAGLRVPELPDRLTLFGLTALPASYVRVLAALGAHHAVHLFLLHPSPALWTAVAADLEGSPAAADLDGSPAAADLEGSPAAAGRRDADPSRGLARHPLLGSWGRDARELQVVVAARAPADLHLPLDQPPPTTLLARVQTDVHEDRPPPGRPLAGPDQRPVLADGDRSVQVHACHGRTRQVEVLRDAILHLLADDPTLEPRDIVVMCPDIEAFAPIVQAVFDVPAPTVATAGSPPSRPDLRVRLADRSLRQTNPVLRLVADLLDRADGRMAATEVLDLASREPVRRRFHFDDDDLTRIEGWVADAQIRWGLDADHRAAFALDGVAANTWRAGLDRILLGVAMADEDDRLVGGVAPLDDVEGTDVERAGRLAELVDRLDEVVGRLAGPQPVAGWRDALAHAADLLASTGEADRWQRVQLDRLLDELVEEASGPAGPSPVTLALAEARALFADRLRGRPTRANHRTGDLTVCTLVPMRSVPHRVVCLLGMDDGTFPRRTVPDGDDLIDRVPRVGDRDPRTEDRQLLLDALLAATDTLVVTYTGRDECTNDPRAPAVPVGELLDVIDATVRTGGAAPARDRVVVDHPLQPFDPATFTAGALGREGPWGFDRTALAGARASVAGTRTTRRFLAEPLPHGEPADPVRLADLVAFLGHPVRAFLRERLEVTPPRPGEEPADAIAVELSPLARYAVGDRLLATRLGGGDEHRWAAAERARGVLPPGALADRALADLRADVDAIAEATAATLTELGCDPTTTPAPLPVAVDLGGGRTLVGTVPALVGDVALSVQYARLGPKHRLAAWAHLLAAQAADPQRSFCAVTVGRANRYGRNAPRVSVSRLGPLGEGPDERAAAARSTLVTLVDLYDRGTREPLPLYCKTSAAWAAAARDGKDQGVARKAWVTTREFPQEDRDPAHRLVLGEVLPFEELLRLPPCPDEQGDGWFDDSEPTRVGRYARRLWDRLLDAEEVDDR